MNGVTCLVLLTACGAVQGGTSGRSEPAGGGGVQRFDALAIRLELEATSVHSGTEIESRLLIRNRSGEIITDPGCLIAAGRYALVPVDEPGAELWLAPVVDCAGSFPMPDGFEESYSGPTFPATTKFGDPLAPGRYIASLEIKGLSHRLEQPVDVVK